MSSVSLSLIKNVNLEGRDFFLYSASARSKIFYNYEIEDEGLTQ